MQQDMEYFSPQQEETVSNLERRGMYKNFRVGRVKYLNESSGILVEVIELCLGSTGEYFATYNLYLDIDSKFAPKVEYTSVGDWVLVGFYIQSFRNGPSFNTSLRLRHYEKMLPNNKEVSVEIRDSRNADKDRTYFVPERAFETIKLITNKTQFNEYGKR